MTMRPAQQLTLNFVPGLTSQYRSLREVAAAAVYASRKGVAGVAGDLDMGPTDLTKRLNLEGSEPRPLRVEDLEGIIESTGDCRPIYWLIEKFLRDPESVKQQAVSQLATLLPQLIELTRQAGIRP
jgi:hypothetical protein